MPTFSSGTDNMIAALGQSNRVCQVILDLASWQLEEILAPMQAPFPELTDLQLWSYGEPLSVISDLFLGRSAPRPQVGIDFISRIAETTSTYCSPRRTSSFTFMIFLIPGTFPPKQWSLSSFLCY